MRRTKPKTSSDRDQALFEAGIKLGALYHQFVGTPLNPRTVRSLETAIEQSISLQPYVKSIRVKINREMVKKNLNKFGYCELRGEMLEADVEIQVREVEARVGLSLRDGYPLMYVKKISKKGRQRE